MTDITETATNDENGISIEYVPESCMKESFLRGIIVGSLSTIVAVGVGFMMLMVLT